MRRCVAGVALFQAGGAGLHPPSVSSVRACHRPPPGTGVSALASRCSVYSGGAQRAVCTVERSRITFLYTPASASHASCTICPHVFPATSAVLCLIISITAALRLESDCCCNLLKCSLKSLLDGSSQNDRGLKNIKKNRDRHQQ